MLAKSLACACGATLFVRELAPGLAARICSACGGALLALDDYRLWRQSARLPAAEAATALPELPEDTGKARCCPACGAPIARYRVAPGSSVRLDRCQRCQLVWLDGGEWPALIEAGLIDRLDSILADAWQKRIQAEEARQRREATLRQRLGDDVVDELQRIQSWLHGRPNSGELLALLSGEPI